MRPIRDTIPLDEALALLRQAAVPVDRVERIVISDASGRVSSAEVIARADVPPFDRAAMDGYAVIAADTFGAGRSAARALRCIGTVYTGETGHTAVSSGECIEIATGAPVPPGADAVVMVEETERVGDEVRILTPVYPRQHLTRRGADMIAGQTLVERGTLLNPSRVGALAACGIGDVEVFARPRVAIVSTGNELVDPGAPLAPGQIYDINKYTLAAIVHEHGGHAITHESAGDTLEDLGRAVDEAAAEDIIVFSGGSSVGERDLVLDLIAARGEVLFHGIAVKPGKPTALGRIGGKPVLGMPGYPTSCLSNGYLFLAPLLRMTARLPPHEPRTIAARLSQRVVSTTGRHQFYTVRIEDGEAIPAFKQSGDITSMSQADGYFEIPAQTDIVEKGEIVQVKLF
jgi:molybdenum cofactor synthesis domain-containing protein